MSEVKLLPCPFCGSHNVGMFFRVEKGAVRYVDGIKKNKLLYYASCKDCRCKGGCSISYVALHEYDREADKGQLVAAAIWNQREPMERITRHIEEQERLAGQRAFEFNHQGGKTIADLMAYGMYEAYESLNKFIRERR